MISELMKRGTTFDGPAITMLRERTSLSYQVVAGGRLAMNSGVCRVRVVNRLHVAFERRLEQHLRRIGDRIGRRLEAGERRSRAAADHGDQRIER